MQQLKAEVVELMAEIERLNAEVVELKHEDTNHTTRARPGHTIVVAFTEDEANEMRHIAEEMVSCGQTWVHVSVDRCGPCSPWHLSQVAEEISANGNHIVILSSRLQT